MDLKDIYCPLNNNDLKGLKIPLGFTKQTVFFLILEPCPLFPRSFTLENLQFQVLSPVPLKFNNF